MMSLIFGSRGAVRVGSGAGARRGSRTPSSLSGLVCVLDLPALCVARIPASLLGRSRGQLSTHEFVFQRVFEWSKSL